MQSHTHLVVGVTSAMKTLTILASFVSALTITTLLGSGTVFAGDSVSTEPKSDIDEQIYAIGKATKSDQISVTVRFGELNLDNEKGVAVLYSRLQRAAEYVCGVEPYSVSRSRTWHAVTSACYSATLSASVDKIDNLALKQMHQNVEPAPAVVAKVE
jgi:UrcA family protein